MRFVTAIEQGLRNRWRRAAGGALTLIMMSVVAVLGLALVGSDVLASWKASADVEQALAASSASQGPLTFEAPTSTLLRFQAKEKIVQNGKDRVNDAALLVEDWRYTQSPLAQFEDVRNLLLLYELITDVTLLQNNLDAENFLMFIQFQMGFNQLFNTLRPATPQFATPVG